MFLSKYSIVSFKPLHQYWVLVNFCGFQLQIVALGLSSHWNAARLTQGCYQAHASIVSHNEIHYDTLINLKIFLLAIFHLINKKIFLAIFQLLDFIVPTAIVTPTIFDPIQDCDVSIHVGQNCLEDDNNAALKKSLFNLFWYLKLWFCHP